MGDEHQEYNRGLNWGRGPFPEAPVQAVTKELTKDSLEIFTWTLHS